MPGTARVSDRDYVATMQAINVAIVNPVFMLLFLGTAVALAAGAAAHYREGQLSRRGWVLAAAAALYVAGVIGVTVARNVPLNDKLAEFELDGANDTAVSERRSSYESPWNTWHYVRTAANIASFCLAIIAAHDAPHEVEGTGHTALDGSC